MKLSRNANHWLPRVTAYVLVAVFRIMLPTRFRYPEWERLNKPSDDVVPTCRVPDDCIDPSRRALFISRGVMRDLIHELEESA